MKIQIQIASESKDSNLASTLAHETRKSHTSRRNFLEVVCSLLLALCLGSFSACGDDDKNGSDKSNGTKAGEEICACFTTTGMPNIDLNEDDSFIETPEGYEIFTKWRECVLKVPEKYNMVLDDDSNYVFGNTSDQKDYEAALTKCLLDE